MKRYLLLLATFLTLAFNAKALDYETAREQAYYLTDKMAYELNLNDAQYNDAFEINLDYLLSLNSPMDIELAYLRNRNEDLRYILMNWQWRAFMAEEYFFNPVRWVSGAWYFPIYRHYHRTYYFYDRPRIFWDYRGAHGRVYYHGRSFYADRRHSWNGGLRGNHHGLIGRPINGRNGRYDNHGRFGNDHRRDYSNQYNRYNRNDRSQRRDYNNGYDRNDRYNRRDYNNRSDRSSRNSLNDRINNPVQRYDRGDMRSSSRTTVNSMRNFGTTRSTGVESRGVTDNQNMGAGRSISSGRSMESGRSAGSTRGDFQGGGSRSSGRR